MAYDELVEYGTHTIQKIIELDRDSVKPLRLYLPYFQRPFVWRVQQQKELVASLLSGIPIGGILLFEGEKGDYSSIPLYYNYLNRDKYYSSEPCLFLLDGQQRFSTLKGVLTDPYSKEDIESLKHRNFIPDIIESKEIINNVDPKLKYRWFVRMEAPEGSEDVFGFKDLEFNPDRIYSPEEYMDFIDYEPINLMRGNFSLEKTLSSIESAAIHEKIIPLWLLLDERAEKDGTLDHIIGSIAEQQKRIKYGKSEKTGERHERNWAAKIKPFLIERLLKAQVPSIVLKKEAGALSTALFDASNRTGTKLSTYDLIAAKMARTEKNQKKGEQKSLSELIGELFKQQTKLDDRIKGNVPVDSWDPLSEGLGLWDSKSRGFPSTSFQNRFLTCLGIEIYLKKKSANFPKIEATKTKYLLQKGDPDSIERNWEEVTKTILKVFQFLHFRCGVIKMNDLQYDLMVLPLYVVFREGHLDEKIFSKCEYWYWAALFSGRYRDNQNTRAIEDCERLYNYCRESELQNPFEIYEKNVFNDIGYSDFDHLGYQEERGDFSKALDEPIMQYLLSRGRLKDIKDDGAIMTAWGFAQGKMVKHRHHFLPVTDRRNQPDHPLNSPLNQTYISQEANLALSHDTQKYAELKWKSNEYKTGHCLPDDFEDLVNEYRNNRDKDEYLKKFLRKRFDKLSGDVKNTLRSKQGV